MTTVESFQIKLDGEVDQVELLTVIDMLLGISSVTDIAAENVAPAERVKLSVATPERGSFVLNLQIWPTEMMADVAPLLSNVTLASTGAILYIVVNLLKIRKLLLQEPASEAVEIASENNETSIELSNSDGNKIVVDKRSYEIYLNSEDVGPAIDKIFAPLSANENVNEFKIVDHSGEVVFLADEEDINNISEGQYQEILDDDSENVVTVNTILTIIRPSFDSKLTWRFIYDGRAITAKVLHKQFNENIDVGQESFTKGDQLRVRFEYDNVLHEDLGVRVRKNYRVVEVFEHISRSSQQMEMYD